jgi:hypothetical protein
VLIESLGISLPCQVMLAGVLMACPRCTVDDRY